MPEERNYELFYDYYRKNLNNDSILPNVTHKYLAKLENEGKLKAIVTQNIDGLELESGIDKEKVVFAHGNFLEAHCPSCREDIDFNKQQVRFFNRTYLRSVRMVPLERYYWQFSKRDAKKLNDWFIELLKKNNKVDMSCEVDVRLQKFEE